MTMGFKEDNANETERAAMLVRNDPRNLAFANGNTTSMVHRRNGNGKTDDLTLAEIKAEIAFLWKDPNNYTTDQIAEKVSDMFQLEGEARINPRNVKYHISELIKYWKRASLMSVDDKMAMCLARYAQLDALAEEAFFMSIQGKEINHMKRQIDKAHSKDREKLIAELVAEEREKMRAEGKEPKLFDADEFREALEITQEKIETYQRTESGVPDARFLREMIVINDRRVELWNLKEHGSVMNKDQEAAKMDDKERVKRMTAVLTTAIQRRDGNLPGLAKPQPLGGHKGIQGEATTFDEEDLEDIEL